MEIKDLNKSELWNRSVRFGRNAHGDQLRKYTGESYFESHCMNVAMNVASATEDVEVICAALLHDVIEDTPIMYSGVKEFGGMRMAQIVMELTAHGREVDKLYDRKTRQGFKRERMMEMSDEAKLIKRFDIADNVKDIVIYDPKFAAVYLAEKAEELRIINAV